MRFAIEIDRRQVLLWFLITLLELHFVVSADFEFDKNHFGVMFTPFVKHMKKDQYFIDKASYTSENIKTMLTLISKRFSKVLTTEVGAIDDTYVFNHTYGNSRASVYSGEIAAFINRESGEKKLSLFLGVSQYSAPDVTDTAVSLAFGSAEKANKIFLGTVQAIVFERIVTEEHAQQTLNYLDSYRLKKSEIGVKLAIKHKCYQHEIVKLFKQNNTFERMQQEIMLRVDIIICDGFLWNRDMEKGPEHIFQSVASYMLTIKNTFNEFSPNAEVIFTSLWLTGGFKEWETADNLRRYWKTASLWAFKNKFTVFMAEAFDNPWRGKYEPSFAHMGWWKLNANSQINSVDGYMEKALGNRLKNTTEKVENPREKTANPGKNNTKAEESWSDVSIVLAVIGSIIILIGLAGIALLFPRAEKKSAPLSQVEMQHFLFGTSGHIDARDSLGDTIENALNGSYDNSIEIPKDKLIMDHSHLLGSGKFGYVIKAHIEGDDGEFTEVAVKVAKQDAHMSALRGLLSEIKIMAYLGRHPNIVSLVGACTAELSQGVVYVALELCSLGSLQNFLRENKSTGASRIAYYNITSAVSFEDMARWSHEIACGMLHLENRHVVHADLATRNVLLTSDKTAKIADFGLSRRMYNYLDYVKTQQEPLPWRWMALESLNRMEFSTKSDVWSYGVTLWEIFSMGDTPYQGRVYNEDFVDELEDGLRPNRPPFVSSEIYAMMKKCWNMDPKMRPGFSELVPFTGKVFRECRNGNDALLYLKLQDPEVEGETCFPVDG